MKKISKQLENKIIKCSKLYNQANVLNEEIRRWLWKNKLNLNDMLIDSCQLSCDPQGFINFLNGEPSEFGDVVEDFILDDDINFDDFN